MGTYCLLLLLPRKSSDYSPHKTLSQILLINLRENDHLPLTKPRVKVKVNFQLTRLAELVRQLVESLSIRLTIIPYILVELGIDSTIFPSKLMSNSPSSYSSSCMNNSSSSSSSEEHSMLRLAELYEQLAEFIFIRRTLYAETRRAV